MRLLAESLSEQFGIALLHGDVREAEAVARDALAASLDERMLYERVVAPAMHRIGELWAEGEISVAQEHLATEIANQALVVAHSLQQAAERRAGARMMLAAVEGERHVMGLDMAAKLLDSAGYDVLSLGADVPTDALADIVEAHEPSLFALSATMPEAGRRLPQAVAAINEARSSVGVIVGGAAAREAVLPQVRVVYAERVSEILDAADALAQGSGLN